MGELLEVEGGLQLSQPLIHLKVELGDVQKAGELETPFLRMLLSNQISIRSLRVHILEIEYTHEDQPLIKNLTQDDIV